MTVSQTGLCLHVSGWGAFPETHINWAYLDAITLIILPRGASVLRISTKDGQVKTMRTWAFADGPDAYLAAFGTYAKLGGYALTGSKLKSPVLGKRSWTLEQTST